MAGDGVYVPARFWGHGGLAGVFIPSRRGYVRLLRAIKRRYMIRFMRGTIRKRRLYL